MEIPNDRGDESFADDLNMWPGIVSGRVALLLRSTEIQPAAAPICPPSTRSGGVSSALCVMVLPPRMPLMSSMHAVHPIQLSSCGLVGGPLCTLCLPPPRLGSCRGILVSAPPLRHGIGVLIHPMHPIRLRLLPFPDRKSTRLNSSHSGESRMPSSA